MSRVRIAALLAAALTVPLLLTACSGGDDDPVVPSGMSGGMPSGMTSEMTQAEAAEEGASLLASPRPGLTTPPLTGGGAGGPILTCTGLDSPLAGAAEVSSRDDEGRTLPNLTLDCLGGGEAVTLGELRGPLVLNVWASWCLPCRAELPFLTAAHEALGERVRFAGIALTDSDGPSRDWLSFHGVDWPSLADHQGAVRGPLRIPGPPVTLFVNSDGRIVEVHYGAFTSARQVQDAIAEHLGIS
ncbi:TlpA disulfide reductase family protein [Sporichthya sp.]|uniref:TlpA family protein disulfide reductase n=1 Tax=Sporichthya sp. TaxID=65475 RepID=UPI00179627FC|nr:TlpA disulfide reductase family protein [Sporichthya sp.]MBA3744035.1 TlpA family protein disulfide reductase [Sporichthya sp.]